MSFLVSHGHNYSNFFVSFFNEIMKQASGRIPKLILRYNLQHHLTINQITAVVQILTWVDIVCAISFR